MTISDLSGSDPVNSIKDVTDKSRIISMLFVAVYMVVSLPYPATDVTLDLLLILVYFHSHKTVEEIRKIYRLYLRISLVFTASP